MVKSAQLIEKVPPTISSSNQVPLNQVVTFTNIVKIPPTCLSVNNVPNTRPIPIFSRAMINGTRNTNRIDELKESSLISAMHEFYFA